MKRTVTILFIFVEIITSAASLFAAQNEKAAILDFKAYNCDESLARIVTDFVSTKIFDARIFTIVEREQIDKVIREIELQKTKYTESESAVKTGKLLAAQKTILGSVHKIDKYYLILKVINVTDGTVEGDYRVPVKDESTVEDGVNELVNLMLYDFKNEVFYSYSVSAGYYYRGGDFKKIAKYGYGINVSFNIHNILFSKTALSLFTGLYYFEPRYNSIDSLISLPVGANMGYTYKLSQRIRMIPYIGFGYLISMMTYDRNGADAYGNYEYSRKYYFDPMLSVKLNMEYLLFSNIYVSVTPSYMVFFEKNHTPQILGLNIGAKMLF